MIKYVTAVEWVCPKCHDTGLARSPEAAAEDLGEHTEEYH